MASKNITITATGHFIPCPEPAPAGAAELFKSHAGDASIHVTPDLKQLLLNLQASATNNMTISIDSVTGLRSMLGAVTGAFIFQGSCTAEELESKEKVAGHVWQVGDKEYACDGTNWIELGFNMDLSNYVTSDTLLTTLDNYVLTTDLSDYATVVSVDNHIEDTVVHVTAEERTAWNAKASAQDINDALNPVLSRVAAVEGAIAILDPSSVVAQRATILNTGTDEDPQVITMAVGSRYVATKPFTGTLPAESNDGSIIYLYVKDGSAKMTVAPASGDKIDGSAEILSVGIDSGGLAMSSANYMFVYDAANANWILL